jgi:thiopurine S-methyltransferase
MTVETDVTNPASPAFWNERWASGRTGWDMGGPHPLLGRLVDEAKDYRLLPDGARILEPGCGRAHNGAALARQGYQVVSSDVSPGAIAAAKELYADVPHLELCVQDAMAVVPAWKESFQAVFDRAFLCALPPALRADYVKTVFSHLAPGGLFLSLPFTKVVLEEGRSGPPFALTMSELTELLSSGFSLVHAEEHRNPNQDDRIQSEMICIFRRRARLLVETPRS